MAEQFATQDAFLAEALAAQAAAVKRSMRIDYIGGRKEIRPYDDYCHYCAKFYTWSFACGAAKARPKLLRLVKDGVIESHQRCERRGSALIFQFPRAVCDDMAARATEELLAEGYAPRG